MITSRPFGLLSDGTPVTCWRLEQEGAYVDITDYGAAIVSIVVPDRNHQPADVVLGYEDAGGYEQNKGCLGATVGRHANRIGGGWFTLNGRTYHLETNNGPNHLHGGTDSYYRRMFRGEAEGDTLRLFLHSPDGDQGYPGNLELTVSYTFAHRRLEVRFEAVCDQDTVLNLTNHSYFDLSCGADPMGQLLTLAAERFCENDENTLPTGRLLPVEDTPFDFRQEKPVGRDLAAEDVQLLRCGGYDHNFALDNGGVLTPCAILRSPETGIRMVLSTDLPGVQRYSANSLRGTGKGSRVHGKNGAVCLEPQFFPNALHNPQWEQPVLRAGEKFDRHIVYQFE